MTTYTLSIEDWVGTGVNVTERAIMVVGANGFKTEETYNPNKETGPFNSNGPFDTSFSIVHPFRDIANSVAQHFMDANNGVPPEQIKYAPQMKYDISLNRDRQKLFSGILFQELSKLLDNQRERSMAMRYAASEA